MLLPLHITAGVLGLLSGAIALYTFKGARLHRRSGTVFVYALLTMSFFGLVMAVTRGVAPVINVPAALLTAYLVTTALVTVRPPMAWSRRLDTGGMWLAFALGAACVLFGVQAIARGGPERGFAFPLFMFATAALFAAVGDLRMIRAGGPLRGGPRLARHLWRMCFALFIACMSFFLGQAKVFPAAIRSSGLLPIPVLVVLVTMIYWMWKVRRGRTRGITFTAPAALGATDPRASRA